MEEINFDVPQSARIWNYWMGGKDNYPVDRAAGDAWAAIQPEIVDIARQSRQFLIRTVRYLAEEAGIRQFLDIGTGLPTLQNTHEVAQAIAPESRVVYVDNDPLVLAHARALLVNTTPEGVTTYVEADYHAPSLIVADARNILNFNEPVAVMFMGVLGHVAEYQRAREIVARVVDSTPTGSTLTLWENTNLTESARLAASEYPDSGAVPYRLCSVEQVAGFFKSMELIEPGVVPINHWRPNRIEVGTLPAGIDAYGAVGRKV
ncbi:SAM-dependent methyltransferase [Pseudonocardia eucalypti]|uniref:SAM-dependent methyltransferase n=1 Tax=Pseudonocardia eucalypti TaxID=648755 RepID=A0ABP9QMR7_9PSEU|nr:ubiquinone/menaquinone biosynthesis C-methylase UbiE [Pseudonocardia eucalypti]